MNSNEDKSKPVLPGNPFVAGPTQVFTATPRPVVTAKQSGGLTALPTHSVTAVAPKRALYEERGWTIVSTHGARQVYQGLYQATYRGTGERRTYRGHIILNSDEDPFSRVVPFLSNPPAEVHSHPKHLCVRHISGDTYRVFWSHPANNLDDAILYVERILDESINSH